jgi:DNA polymerase lambda
MRLLANEMKMALNQRGLWSGVMRDAITNQKISTGTLNGSPMSMGLFIHDSLGHLIASRTEKEIFAALKVPWQEPHERNRA